MFKDIGCYRKILVTGPQRSGTRICAKMIEYDCGHEYLDERAIYTDSVYALINIIAYEGEHVIQCPTMSRWCHIFAKVPGVAVVFMIRDVGEIIASQARIHWQWENVERSLYPGNYEKALPIAAIKYHFWNEYQKPLFQYNAFEIAYNDLAHHALWVAKDERDNWKFDRTVL